MFITDQILKSRKNLIQDLKVIKAEDSALLRIPANVSELYIPLGCDIRFQSIGHPKSYFAENGKAYFFTPRSRGLELDLYNGGKCLLLEVDPLYSSCLKHQLSPFSSDSYELDLDSDAMDAFMNAGARGDIDCCNDLLLSQICNKEVSFLTNNFLALGAELIREANGKIKIKEVYNTLGISKSKLEQDFMRGLGLTPKEYCKVERFKCFVDKRVAIPGMSLTELTYQCGYYDQSHLIKDFNYFLGISPGRFFDGMGA